MLVCKAGRVLLGYGLVDHPFCWRGSLIGELSVLLIQVAFLNHTFPSLGRLASIGRVQYNKGNVTLTSFRFAVKSAHNHCVVKADTHVKQVKL